MRAGIAVAIAGVVGLAAAGLGIYLSPPPPKQLPDIQFQDGSGRTRSLGEFRGRVVLLNIWATWCAPCREEMPALDRLQTKLGGPGFEVVALSIDPQGAEVVRRFFGETGIKALQLYIDPTARAGFRLATAGVPATLLVDRSGREVWRRVGPAQWDAPEMVLELRRMIEAPAR